MEALPRLSVIVISHNMQREISRTLYTLTSIYQKSVTPQEYEVIVIDNASHTPLDVNLVRTFGDNFYLYHYELSPQSPCAAINYGVSLAKGELVMICIDGARMLSPGIISATLQAATLFSNAFIYTINMHLGDKPQTISISEGYDKHVEDKLLSQVNWSENGYVLFDIACLGLSSAGGYFGKANESNCFTVSRQNYLAGGGYDERFAQLGGGLANLDIFNRYHAQTDIIPVLLLGEATFHQVHGGIASNASLTNHPEQIMLQEYKTIKQTAYEAIFTPPIYYGPLNSYAQKFAIRPENVMLNIITYAGNAQNIEKQDYSSNPPQRQVKQVQFSIENNNNSYSVHLITGMHRSGTSMITQALQHCSVSLGDPTQLMNEPHPSNPDGHFEAWPIVQLNNELLALADATWNTPPKDDIDWVNGQYRLLQSKAHTTLQNLYANSNTMPAHLAIKDPRFTFTLPFWQTVLQHPKLIICVRHPVEVALSLNTRNQMSIHDGLHLWLEYNRRLLAPPPDTQVVFTHYAQWMRNPYQELIKVTGFLGLQPTQAQAQQAIAAIKSQYRHYNHAQHNIYLSPQIIDCYQALCAKTGEVCYINYQSYTINLKQQLATDMAQVVESTQQALAYYRERVAQLEQELVKQRQQRA